MQSAPLAVAQAGLQAAAAAVTAGLARLSGNSAAQSEQDAEHRRQLEALADELADVDEESLAGSFRAAAPTRGGCASSRAAAVAAAVAEVAREAAEREIAALQSAKAQQEEQQEGEGSAGPSWEGRRALWQMHHGARSKVFTSLSLDSDEEEEVCGGSDDDQTFMGDSAMSMDGRHKAAAKLDAAVVAAEPAGGPPAAAPGIIWCH